MLVTFQSILPIFLLIIGGNVLRRLPVFPADFWTGLDRMGFFVLYPVLLFVTVLKADFGALSLGAVMSAMALSWTMLGLITLALWPLLRRMRTSRPGFSSVFQASVRWNGFIALVVAEKMFPPEGAAMVALVMASMVIPINVVTVVVISWFTSAKPEVTAVARRVATNPMIIGTALALVLRLLPGGLPGPILDTLNLVARAALGMGLFAIGAGLRPEDLRRITPAILTPTLLKLFVLPALVLGVALALGVSGPQLTYMALCAAVPTAMNGYVLARQMGGDAQAYAATATLQTAISFLSIPLILWVAAQFAAG